jgi:tetratricopeptide (TPR) repeat protein
MQHQPTLDGHLLIANVVAMRLTSVGDFVYRVTQPSVAMGRLPGVRTITVNVLSPHLDDVCLAADVLILHLLTEEDLIPVVARRQRLGRPTVYEISDNFLAAHKGVGVSGWFSDPVHRANALHLARMADAVQVVGTGLYQRFGDLNPRTEIFENHIETLGRPPRPPGATVRLGWGGSSGHSEDLRHVSPVVMEICRRHPNVVFAFMGDAKLFEGLFAALPAERKSYTPPGSLADYLRFVETLDIGIAPILPTAYNHCRSDVKFLELASRGVVPVLAAVTPYLQHVVNGHNAFLFRDNAELTSILDRLVSEPETRAAVAARAHDYVARERIEDPRADDRVRFYRSLGAFPAGAALSTMPTRRLLPDSEAYEVGATAEETLLCEGIVAASHSQFAQARLLFQRASELRPDYALAQFWAGRTYELAGEPVEAAALFQHALGVAPRSLRTRLHLARAQESAGEPRAALDTIITALANAGEHAPAHERAARLAEALALPEEAARFYRQAIAAGPEYGPAVVGLWRLAARGGDGRDVRQLLERASSLTSEDASVHHALAECLLADHEVLGAARHCARAVELDRAHRPARAMLARLLAIMDPQPTAA